MLVNSDCAGAKAHQTDDNLKEDFTTRYSFCNRFSCFEGVKMAKNACIFFTSAKQR